MHLIYLDESGNTGTNLSDPQQTVAQQKRSGQGDESRQRKKSEAHWSLVNLCSTTNLTLNKFFQKTLSSTPRASCRESGTPRPTIDYEPGGIWIKFPFSTAYLAKTSNGPNAKKSSGKVRGKFGESSGKVRGKFGESSGKTVDKIIAIARKSPSVSIPQMAEILGISTRAVEKFASSNKPIASAASDRLKAETGKSWNEDSPDANPPKAKLWTSPTANCLS